ncbi:MAG: pyruvate kinase [Bacteroidales bacterium]|nr:pyruvate kinase [Candidatus Colimorpha merdihippi]MCQ2282341.1 pyruvate kinase [Bacteroidales bacterium]
MKKTKIVASIGPSSYNPDVFEKMVLAGANVARINFSHATEEEKQTVVATVNEVRRRTGMNIGIMYDTKGPELRCGEMANGEIQLVEGAIINIVKDSVLGTEEQFSVNHPHVIDLLNIGDQILLENGLMQLEVVGHNSQQARCIVRMGGTLGSKKSMSVPGVRLQIPFLSDTDLQDIIYACQNQGDFLACSFVSTAADIMVVRSVLVAQNRADMKVIAKIESQEGMDNLDAIAQVADGIMVARGDLGVEVPMEDLPIYQKRIISTCRRYGKICIVATEMLESMKHSIRPTRAEVTDISNAVFSGTDAVMLSGETTTGEYPVEAVSVMAKICSHTEDSHHYKNIYAKPHPSTIAEIMSTSVAATANELGAKLIVVPTVKGVSARLLSNLEPICPILALTDDEQIMRSLTLNYGVYCKRVPHIESYSQAIETTKQAAHEWMELHTGDIVITTGGFHADPQDGQSNFMKVDRI